MSQTPALPAESVPVYVRHWQHCPGTEDCVRTGEVLSFAEALDRFVTVVELRDIGPDVPVPFLAD